MLYPIMIAVAVGGLYFAGVGIGKGTAFVYHKAKNGVQNFGCLLTTAHKCVKK